MWQSWSAVLGLAFHLTTEEILFFIDTAKDKCLWPVVGVDFCSSQGQCHIFKVDFNLKHDWKTGVTGERPLRAENQQSTTGVEERIGPRPRWRKAHALTTVPPTALTCYMRLQYICAHSAGKPHPFHVKSNLQPPPQPSVALESYLERTKFEIASITFSNKKDNLSARQREALKTLSANRDLSQKSGQRDHNCHNGY